MLLSEFDRRSRWMIGTSAALVPRQELAGHGGRSLAEALRYSMSFLIKGLVLDDGTCLYVDGVFQPTMSAKDYLVGDIEAVEVYGSGADYTGTVTSRAGSPASRLPPRAQCGWPERRSSLSTGGQFGVARGRANPARVEAIVIWLKR